MYVDFYGLREPPFNLTPDPQYFFLSAGHRRALSYLTYGIMERKGFMQLTGEAGSGKTMLVRRLLAEIQNRAVTAYVLNPADTFDGLLRYILKDMGARVPPDTVSQTERLDSLYQFLLEQEQAGIPVLVIFDDAQILPFDVLEEIRMISDFETTNEKLIQIAFVGQPNFKELVASPRLRQLAQRISIRHHLGPLLQNEVPAYLEHRLHVAGGDRIHFTGMAKDIIWEYTKGIPRLINVVGDYALLVGYVNETSVLNHRILNEAIAELEGRAAPLEGEVAAQEEGFQSPWPDAPQSRTRRRRGRRIRRRVSPTDAPDSGEDGEQAAAASPEGEPAVADVPDPWADGQDDVARAPVEPAPATTTGAPSPDAPDPTGQPVEIPPGTIAPRPRRQRWQRQVVATDEERESLAAQALERGREFGLASEVPDGGDQSAAAAELLAPVYGQVEDPGLSLSGGLAAEGPARRSGRGVWRRVGRALFGWLLH